MRAKKCNITKRILLLSATALLNIFIRIKLFEFYHIYRSQFNGNLCEIGPFEMLAKEEEEKTFTKNVPQFIEFFT